MIIVGSIGAAFGPQEAFGTTTSYVFYTISRFLIACGTRGINVTGFVLGNHSRIICKKLYSKLHEKILSKAWK